MILNDEVAVITGSTKGIGRVMAQRFADEGAKVVITGRNQDAGMEVEKSIIDKGLQAIYVPTDVTREEDVEAAVAAAVKSFGKLSVFVNNAAPTELVTGPSAIDNPVRDITTESWLAVLESMLTSTFWGCKYSMPEIAKAGGGAIVNISSIVSLQPMYGVAAYAAAKGAVNSLTRVVAVEGASDRIRCNCIVVGLIPTSEKSAEVPDLTTEERLAWQDEWRQALRDFQLVRGTSDHIASFAAFLASSQAGYLTGLVVPADGGSTIKSALPVKLLSELRHPTDRQNA